MSPTYGLAGWHLYRSAHEGAIVRYGAVSRAVAASCLSAAITARYRGATLNVTSDQRTLQGSSVAYWTGCQSFWTLDVRRTQSLPSGNRQWDTDTHMRANLFSRDVNGKGD